MKRILFTGGGSAGHVVPNLAIMHELRYSCALSYLGTNGIEQALVGEAGYPFYRIECPKLIRAFTLKNLTIPHRLAKAKQDALEVLGRINPDLVFSKGGYVSYPAVWAAAKRGIPVLTHESDLSAGLTTKLIAKKCRYVLTSFPETAQLFKNGKYVGSPVRREILCGERTRARKKFGFSDSRPVLLVFGGGSGSKAINDALYAALPCLLPHFYVLHLTGKGNLLPDPPAGLVQREYEPDMGSAYAAADVVLSRAGSNTVFELLALKKPSVLVPLAHASRGDQAENAAYFARRGLVHILPERELSSLADAVTNAYEDAAMRSALDASSYSSGTGAVLEVIDTLLAGGARE